MAVAAQGSDAGGEVAASARAGEPDRYLAALLAPAGEREALIALAALGAELSRIPVRAVREPMMGEIRLEWWRKALISPEADAPGHAVAAAVRQAIHQYDLPAAAIDGMIDARALELLPAPFPDDAAVQDFLWRTEGTLFALAARVSGLDAGSAAAAAACRAAGEAYGLTRLMLGLPRSLSLGRVPLAISAITAAGLSAHELLAGTGAAQAAALMHAHLARIRASLADARRLFGGIPPRMRGGFLPLALVPPYVRQLERQLQREGGLRAEVQIVPLTRVWRIAGAHLLGRL